MKHIIIDIFIVLFSSSVHAQQGNIDHIQLKLGLIILNLIILIHKTRKILQTIIRGDLPMMFYKFTINTRMKVIMKHCESTF